MSDRKQKIKEIEKKIVALSLDKENNNQEEIVALSRDLVATKKNKRDSRFHEFVPFPKKSKPCRRNYFGLHGDSQVSK